MLLLALLSGCGGGSGAKPEPIRSKTLVVYSSLPRTGGSAALGNAAAAGQRLALADAGGRVGGRKVKLVELDSAGRDERDWDPDRVMENAERAADDPATVAYLGELDLGASAVSLPITNEKSILQVSPADGLTSLTLPQPGPGAGPERFYPVEPRNFLRLVPPDSSLAGPLLTVVRGWGARRVALVHDGGVFGRELAGGLVSVAENRDVAVAAVEKVEPDPSDAAALGRRLENERPDALVYLGTGGAAARTLLAAASRRGLRDRPLLAAGPVTRPGATVGQSAPRRMHAITAMLPPRSYPRSARRILSRLAGREPMPVEALYGYESMRLVLNALSRAGARATNKLAVIAAARRHGPKGSVLGPYAFDRRGDTSLRRLALYTVVRGRARYRGPAPGSGG